MGWRSWNEFGIDVSQDIMEATMDRMVERLRTVDGVKASLMDLGYTDCGLDDGWQDGGAGFNGSFHDAEGKPIINASKFFDMKAMTDYGHEMGLTVGWYMNNCNSKELPSEEPGYESKHMHGDVNALLEFGFDGVKLDACGPYMNLSWWYQLINATGKPMLIENCHWGGEGPPCAGGECPFNYWRTSGDITNTWDSIFARIWTATGSFGVTPPISRPGTWAYPDMLEVGRLPTWEEDRTHFGLWVITSSPLILGFDLNNKTTMDRVWPIISNKEAIAVNQAWSGHPGGPALQQVLPTILLRARVCNASEPRQQEWAWSPSKAPGADGLFDIRALSSDLCVDVARKNPVELQPCAGTDSQLFRYNLTDASIRAPRWEYVPGLKNGCLDINGKHGPAVQLTKCYGQPNDAFVISDVGVWSGGNDVAEFPRLCMQAEHDSSFDKHIWAKPLHGNALALLIVNPSDAPLSFRLPLSTLPQLQKAPGLAYKVRDVWAHQDNEHVVDTLYTGTIGRHDSRFYVLRPTRMMPRANFV